MNEDTKERKCKGRKGKKTILIFILVIALGGFGLHYCGHHRDGGYHGHHGWHHGGNPEKKAEYIVKRIKSKLDLTDAQVVKVNKIKDDILAKRKEMKSLKKGIAKEVIAQTKKDKVDQEKLNQLFASKEKKIKELRGFMVAKYAEFHAILTPKQRKELAELMEDRFKRWHK